MRYARKLALLATMVAAVLAMTAASASAQGLNITQEPGGAPCPAVSQVGHTISGGCVVHAVSVGTITLRAHVFGFESVDSVCTNEFTARLNAAGSGFLTAQNLAGAGCTRRPCAEEATGTRLPWAGTGRETGPGTEGITVNFCLWGLTNETATNCEVTVPFSETAGVNHNYTFVANDTPCHGVAGFRGELTGTWRTEGTGIEVNHV